MNLVDLLRAEGLRVEPVAGWENHRRPGGFTPVGVMCHHTASNRNGGNAPSLKTVTDGRPDLAGPLCTLLVARDGLVYVVAAGRANHAGAGSSRVLEDVKRDIAPKGDAAKLGLADDITGNGWYYGIEVENDGVGEPYPPAQIDAVARCGSALCRPGGWTANRVVHHREHTRRKIDMSYRGDLRGLVRARLIGIPSPPPAASNLVVITQEIDMATRTFKRATAPGIDHEGNGYFDAGPWGTVGSVKVNQGAYWPKDFDLRITGEGEVDGQHRVFFRGPVNLGPFGVLVESFA